MKKINQKKREVACIFLYTLNVKLVIFLFFHYLSNQRRKKSCGQSFVMLMEIPFNRVFVFDFRSKKKKLK